jgi:predicted AAA+ superfamily ATPase
MVDYPRWQKSSLEQALAARRVVMLTGPRQCGKTTLARMLVSGNTAYRTLDDVAVRQAAESDPHLFVDNVPPGGTLIIDEVQKAPDLLPAIKKVVDQDNRPGQFLITGSANILSLPTVQESLAGRVGKVRLRPLSQGEIDGTKPLFLERAFAQDFKRRKKLSRNDLIEMIFKGGFPEAVRLEGKVRRNWHIDYIDALIEHDLNDIAGIRQVDVMKDLVRVLAAWSSKFMNVSAIGASLSADRRTLANYISALQAFYIVESVPAWHKTDYDRAEKQSKLFMADTGMMTALLGWKPADLSNDPDKPGKAFETFAYNELAAQIDAASEESYHLYHYRDHDKREIDFLIERDDQHMLAIEIKSGITVRKSDFKYIKWFRDNLAKGKPLIGIVLYAGDEVLSFGENLWAVPFDCMWRV